MEKMNTQHHNFMFPSYPFSVYDNNHTIVSILILLMTSDKLITLVIHVNHTNLENIMYIRDLY